MKVLVVGRGGREHALVWKLAQSARVEQVYAAPGNPGIAQTASCVPINADLDVSTGAELHREIVRLRDFALAKGIGLTVVGPESSLAGGLVDVFTAAGLKVFGPTAAAARLESDKAFAKELMAGAGVPTAAHRTFTDSAQAVAYVREQGAPIVVKASGLAAGKGALVCDTVEEAIDSIRQLMDERVFGTSGATVVVEEYMEGEEASFFALTDGTDFVPLVSAQDHKAILEGDRGLNTGGMGAYAPAPVLTPQLMQTTGDRIINPVLAAMRDRGCPFRGVLYCGLMIDAAGPRVVEFNCRFGDPEAQVILPLLETDLADVLEAACDGRLASLKITNSSGAAVCVVMASGGYPGPYEKGKTIAGIDAVDGRDGVIVFHAGTTWAKDQLVTNGGRVLGVTAAAANTSMAVERAYAAAARICFEGAYYRRDIAHRALARQHGRTAER